MGIEVVEPPLRVKYVPSEEHLMRARSLGRDVAARLLRT